MGRDFVIDANVSMLAALGIGTLSFGVGFATPFGERETAVTPGSGTAHSARNSGVLCTGMERTVVVQLVPILTSDSSDALSLAFEIENRSKSELEVIHSLAIQNDQGRIFVPPVPADDRFRVDADQVNRQSIEGVPPGLPDGYYVARLRIAWTDPDGNKAAATTRLYFRVGDGNVAVVTGDEWLNESRIMQGQPLEAFESETP